MISDRQFLSVPTSKSFYGRGQAYDISTRERCFVQERDGARRPRASRRDQASTNDLVSTRDRVSTNDLVSDRDSKSAIDRVSEKSLRAIKRVRGPQKSLRTIKESTDYKRVYGL